jgi:hypothetical protein
VIDDCDGRHIGITLAWLSDTFDDLAHLQSNTTRALRLFEGSELAYWEFQEATRAAYSATLHRMADAKRPRLKRPMPYWFACLADQCQRRRVGMTAQEAAAWNAGRAYQGQRGTGNKSKDASSQREAAR